MKKSSNAQRGSAMLVALLMVVLLTVLGLGLVLRTRVTMGSAGAERTITKGFYAADSGIHAGFAHLQVNNPCAFSFIMQDQRASAQFPIQVNIPDSRQVGPPQRVAGSEAGGGISGGGTSLVYYSYRIRSDSFEPATQTTRIIEAEVSMGPVTLQPMAPCGP